MTYDTGFLEFFYCLGYNVKNTINFDQSSRGGLVGRWWHFFLPSSFPSGKKLRKVEKNDAVKQREYGSDVASILSRRIHIEVSDTESDSDGSDSSDGEWDN